MAIHIEDIESEWVEYVPDIGDNRDDPEPCIMEIRPMSTREVREMQVQAAREISKGKKSQAIKVSMRLVERVISERVRNVQGCHIRQDILTGEDLVEWGTGELIDDVWQAIQDISHLREGLKKKSVSSSDSAPPGTRP